MSETQAGSLSRKTQSFPTVEMQPGRAYAVGARVHIPQDSASFAIPAGWHAQLPEDSDAIIVVSESAAGFVMVFMVLNLSDDELTSLLSEAPPITQDLVFEPVGRVIRKGNRLAASYAAWSLVGRSLAVIGPNQEGVLYCLGRPPTESSQPDRVLDDLADSTEFTATK